MPTVTQTDSRSWRTDWLCSPWFLALVVTLANAAKPVLIDDTAYLTYARHFASHPLDPYGFEMFWWTVPDSAMTVLVPPVLPYWLAANIAIFGEYPVLLKFWLFPFLFLLAWSLQALLRRFARGTESRLLPLLMLSPAVLPTVNFMLDIPALALGLTSIVAYMRATERRSWFLALAAGVIAGLAMQTKYTALLVPPAMLWFGITHRSFRRAVVAVAVAGGVFVGWELLLVSKYGESHFLHHASGRASRTIRETVEDKLDLMSPLLGHIGCLAIGVGLVAASAVGIPRQSLAALGAVWAVGFLVIVFVPPRWGPTAVATFWHSFGFLVLSSLALCGLLLLLRFRRRNPVRWNADSLFIVGWVLLELVGYFALTPFGAARRVIGVTLIGGLLAGRVLGRIERVRPYRKPPRWMLGFGITAAVAVTALDTFDAFPEKVCARRAAKVVAKEGTTGTVWTAGHWGFQYYCDQAGMKMLVPGKTVLQPGDLLVLPRFPNEDELFRPHIGSVSVLPPADSVEPISEIVWDDAITGQTIPNFYAGFNPVEGREHPRLRVVVYRVRQPWAVPGLHSIPAELP
ncbi:MAG: glycosyltransferase family 39 protein [Gemmataceae bacterium]